MADEIKPPIVDEKMPQAAGLGEVVDEQAGDTELLGMFLPVLRDLGM